MTTEIDVLALVTNGTLREFWERVQIDDGCWIWTGARNERGYGMFTVGGRPHRAHRVSLALATQQNIPKHLFACHHCDNPACVKPSHLFLGTSADNTRDRFLKGRSASGDRHGSRLHPERLARGDRHGSKTHPERWARGITHHLSKYPKRGAFNGMAKLTDADVIAIRARVAAGEKQKDVASDYGITQTSVSNIVVRRTWKHII